MELLLVALALGLLLKLHGLYFGAISLFALKRRKRTPPSEPKTRFAVLIAARNEESVVGRLVDSLKKQEYPKELYEIFVVVNNSTDDTAGEALRHGARVLHCEGKITCKGDALRQAVDRLMDEPCDAFCVFDADNVADSRFLAEMNDAFAAGARVAKGRNEALNPHESWIAGCYGIYFGFFNLIHNRARAACGLSAKLVGTGFVVSRELLREMGGWVTETMAEDAEFAAKCAKAGVRVHWVPGAVAWDEEPNSFRVSLTQRRRWCSGSLQVGERYIPPVAGSIRGAGGKLALDSMMFLLSPFVQVCSLLTLTLTVTAALSRGPAALLLWLLTSYGGTALGAAAVVLLTGQWDRRMLKAIAGFPIFMASWLPLQVLSVLRRTTEWKAIRHGTEAEPVRFSLEESRKAAS